MPAPINTLKKKMLDLEFSVGCWLTLASPAVAEVLAHCGFDWLLIDAEHGPSDTEAIFAQLQAIDAARSRGAHTQAAVRVCWNNAQMVKRVMDCGAQTIMFPAVETQEDAVRAVASTRYPQNNNGGIRGVASTVRAATYSLDGSYIETANEQACVVVLIESAKAFFNVDAIIATEGVDCIFIGPVDLAASMGHLGDVGHSDIQSAISYMAALCAQHGKAIGIYAANLDYVKHYRGLGINFVGLGSDVAWLTRGATSAISAAKSTTAESLNSGAYFKL